MGSLRGLVADLSTFTLQITTAWQAYLTGGLAAAIAGVYEHQVQRTISWESYRWGVWTFLFIALFTVWRRERLRVAETAEALEAAKRQLSTRRPYLLLGRDYDNPAEFNFKTDSMEQFSPFWVRNDGDVAACNIRILVMDENMREFRFSGPDTLPAKSTRKPIRAYLNRVHVSHQLMERLLKQQGRLQAVEHAVRDAGGAELRVPLRIDYLAVSGEAFSEEYDIAYHFGRHETTERIEKRK